MMARFLWAIFMAGFLAGCTEDLRVTVMFDEARGLQVNDRVFRGTNTLGEVKAVEQKPGGRTAVRLQIREDSREMVTDKARFLIQPDPERAGRRAVEVILIGRGGKPLPDKTVVEGASAFSAALEQGGQEIQDWSKRLQEEIERWEKELRQLPEKQWYKELERQMEAWGKDLEKGGAEAKRRFQRDVLPRLEEALRELRKKLEKEGLGKDAEPLERKLKEMKTI